MLLLINMRCTWHSLVQWCTCAWHSLVQSCTCTIMYMYYRVHAYFLQVDWHLLSVALWLLWHRLRRSLPEIGGKTRMWRNKRLVNDVHVHLHVLAGVRVLLHAEFVRDVITSAYPCVRGQQACAYLCCTHSLYFRVCTLYMFTSADVTSTYTHVHMYRHFKVQC